MDEKYSITLWGILPLGDAVPCGTRFEFRHHKDMQYRNDECVTIWGRMLLGVRPPVGVMKGSYHFCSIWDGTTPNYLKKLSQRSELVCQRTLWGYFRIGDGRMTSRLDEVEDRLSELYRRNEWTIALAALFGLVNPHFRKVRRKKCRLSIN